MNTATEHRLFCLLVVGVFVLVSALGAEHVALGDAFQDRLFGERFRAIAPEEVASVVENYPDDAQLLYAASDYFSGDPRQELLQRAIGLDKRYEVVALAQELFRDLSTRPVPDVSEALERLAALDPENALPYWFLADLAFMRNEAEEGFAQIAEALSRPKFDIYAFAHLRAALHLLDVLGRDGILKYSVKAGTLLPHLHAGRHMSEKLIERGQRRLARGDWVGALDDFAAAERLANQILSARPLFAIPELVAVQMKQKVTEARLSLFEAEGDVAGVASSRFQLRMLKAYVQQLGATAREDPVVSVFEWVNVWPRWSEETLKENLAKSGQLAEAFHKGATALQQYVASPGFEQMIDAYFEGLFEEGELAACRKASRFYQQSALPQKHERASQTMAALHRRVQRFPEGKDRKCVDNLKRLGLAIAIYSNDHEALPGSLAVLAAGGYIDHPAILKCPVSGTEYVYSGKGLTFAADPNTITAYDSAPVHHARGGRYLLCLDGHVELVPEEAFQERLRQQQQSD